jgi:transcriptional regulator with XRE-family HTH domain
MIERKKLLGARIKELRKRADLSQDQLAEKVGIDGKYLSRIEVGKRYPSLELLDGIYEGMPDAVKDDGKIQWEAPSNRSGGRYQNTHHVRRDWWRNKAESIGIDVNAGQWIWLYIVGQDRPRQF